MHPCIYQEENKCPSCSFAIYKKCTLFIKSHYRELTKDLRPFKFTNVDFDHPVVYTNHRDIAKSLATIQAINSNIKVKRLTFNQAIDIALSSDDLLKYVYFIDGSKVLGSTETVIKMSSALNSFIDKCGYNNYPVVIFKPGASALDFTAYKQYIP